jgi:hypothetical protein
MTDDELAAIAKGMLPRIRQCVNEAFAKPVPPELAAEISRAVRMLHEAPPIEEHKDTPPPSPARVTRIERDDDGNFVPIYADQPV